MVLASKAGVLGDGAADARPVYFFTLRRDCLQQMIAQQTEQRHWYALPLRRLTHQTHVLQPERCSETSRPEFSLSEDWTVSAKDRRIEQRPNQYLEQPCLRNTSLLGER